MRIKACFSSVFSITCQFTLDWKPTNALRLPDTPDVNRGAVAYVKWNRQDAVWAHRRVRKQWRSTCPIAHSLSILLNLNLTFCRQSTRVAVLAQLWSVESLRKSGDVGVCPVIIIFWSLIFYFSYFFSSITTHFFQIVP